MALFNRKKERAYVPPPEVRTGLAVFADRGTWHVLGINSGAGEVPVSRVGVPEPTPAGLASEFRQSWLRALDGVPAAGNPAAWVHAVRPDVLDPEAAWRAFSLDGGVFFRVVARPAAGITAMRHCWAWPEAGGELVPQSQLHGDLLTVAAGSEWRRLIEHEQEWLRAPAWTTVAHWLRERALLDPRASAWWIAGDDGRPGLPVATQSDAVDAVRAWWNGDWYATGSPLVNAFALPVPVGLEVGYGWLHWQPADSIRPDGLAGVLGFRRVPPERDRVDLLWWDIDRTGQPGSPLRAIEPDGGRLTVERVERLAVTVVATENRPADVDWVEVDAY